MVSKIGDAGDLPTIEVVRQSGRVIYREEVIDWQRVKEERSR